MYVDLFPPPFIDESAGRNTVSLVNRQVFYKSGTSRLETSGKIEYI
ncbi:hypothetical protein LEP1GSC185_2832 [Leptospira licerasiae serovar Varillal str. VAR 010]|uniref:Uncharacterized protein n=1 Tax=Leptospira licerasiae str. MMD4847 TaxID=1049971 RepID=A0ABP2RE30_9LEPT|nr:hypothetical protein LEP1GSC185_2832 [Leptospira licerasiae serovar Varillal str. VAR 010]EJZ41706.1 hypothetical protein LEP1GSC178_0604 [Leptospira licerasiae str. MMD4847]